MITYPKPITFRPWPEASDAISKIIAAHSGQIPQLNTTDAVNKALVEYAKTLPDPEPVAPPKADAPEKA